jgi:hypothetical protein
MQKVATKTERNNETSVYVLWCYNCKNKPNYTNLYSHQQYQLCLLMPFELQKLCYDLITTPSSIRLQFYCFKNWQSEKL